MPGRPTLPTKCHWPWTRGRPPPSRNIRRMGISARLLGEDEHVVLSMRTHWKALIVPALLAVLIVIATVVAAGLLPSGDVGHVGRMVVLVIAAVAVLWLSVWPFLNWLATTYTVTNRRLLTRHGVLTR